MQNQDANLVFGFDCGSNSIGWSVVKEKNGSVEEIVNLGVRIFHKSVKDIAPTPKNVDRRNARLQRRVIQRRSRRKLRMKNYLISLNLLPADLKENFKPEKTLNEIGNPYQLRTKGLDERLSKDEFGRVLLHFVARRGFLSSKKQLAGDLIDDPDMKSYLSAIEESTKPKDKEDKEEGDFKKQVSQLRNEITKSGKRTLGEYLYQTKDLSTLRNRGHLEANQIIRTDRQMYKDELALIWEKQQPFFKYLPEDFYSEIQKIIFYQRPLKLTEDRVGKCSLEQKNKRTRMARLEAQEFRYLTQINNLKWFDKNNNCWVNTSKEQKKHLAEFVKFKEKIGLKEIKIKLGLKANVKINLESEFRGNTTVTKIQNAIGELSWQNLSAIEQKNLVEDLLSIQKKSALKRRLENHWQLSTEQTIKLCLEEFETGYSDHSLKVINILLPFLREGDIYSDARIKAGYSYEEKKIKTDGRLSKPPETRNPVVNKAMNEMKRVVNALILKHGKPTHIRVEMARDLSMSPKRLAEFNSKQSANEEARKRAKETYASIEGIKNISEYNIIKYCLWEDQAGLCVYSGKKIDISQLFSGDIEIDHIIPYKKSMDDSYMNKVVCLQKENQYKKDYTPINAYVKNKEKWEQIKERISKWHKSLDRKKDRFYQSEENLKKDFIANQLNDTRYITTIALPYLKTICTNVTTTKGQITNLLRRKWQLNSLISEKSNRVKDRTDHRHHAVDALVIACINPSIHRQITSYCQSKKKYLFIAEPFSSFKKDAKELLEQIIISYDVNKKLSGKLHEETGLGKIEQKDGKVRLVKRVPISHITGEKRMENVVDESLKKWLKDYLEEQGGCHKKAFNSGNVVFHKDGKTPIYRVRVYNAAAIKKELFLENYLGMKDSEDKFFKFHKFGNNHHLEVFQHPQTGAIKGDCISTYEAAQRQRGTKKIPKQPVVKKDYKGGFKLLMVLYINDIVSVISGDDPKTAKRVYYRVQKFNKQQSSSITLRHHLVSTIKNKDKVVRLTVNKKNFQKYDLRKHQVSVIGDFIHLKKGD